MAVFTGIGSIKRCDIQKWKKRLLVMQMTLVTPTTIQMVKAQKSLVASEIAR
jgi:hypothetical protein